MAILGYVAPSEAFDEAVAELRSAIRDATRATTTFGYGPRYLHSTGQFHKGGPKTGRFLQLVHDGRSRTPRSRARRSASRRSSARRRSATCETLRAHDLPAERITLRGDPVGGAAQADKDHRGEGALMQIGFVGLGKMGGNMVHRIRRDSLHEVVAFDFDEKAVAKAKRKGAQPREGRSPTW